MRQAGPLSFVRVYSAGHTITMQQPQIAQAIFNRAIGGLDLATGSVDVRKEDYATVHQYPSWEWEEEPPRSPVGDGPCYVLNLGLCSPVQRQMFLNGSGIVKDYFLVADSIGECIPNPVQPCMKAKVQTAANETVDEVNTSGSMRKDKNLDMLLKALVAATGLGYIVCMTVLGFYWWTSTHNYSRSAYQQLLQSQKPPY